MWAAVVLGVAATAAAFGYHKYVEISAALAAVEAFPEPPKAMEAVRVRRDQWPVATGAGRTVVALRQVEIRNDNGGTVVEMGFALGDIVDAGQVLVRLEMPQEPATLAATQADARLAEVVFVGAAGCVPVEPAPRDLVAREREGMHGDREEQPNSTWLQVRLNF
jgi:multidrug efflux pump subunit AcrA (membrane-fusion protein)